MYSAANIDVPLEVINVVKSKISGFCGRTRETKSKEKDSIRIMREVVSAWLTLRPWLQL